MEATKVKVRERDLAVCRHRTWHRILFLPPPTPLPPSPPAPPRPSSHTFRHTGFSARLENDTILQEDRTLGENRVLRGTGLHYVTRVTLSLSAFHRVHFDLDFDEGLRPTTMRGDSSREKKEKNKNETRLVFSLFSFFLFLLRSIKGRIRCPRIDNGGAGRLHRGRVGYAMAARMMNFYI